MLHAQRKGAAIAHDERGSPRVSAEDVAQPAIGVIGVRIAPSQVRVLGRHNGKTGSVRSCVISVPGESKPKWICISLCDRFIQLLFEVSKQSGLGGGESRGVSLQCHGSIQLVMS